MDTSIRLFFAIEVSDDLRATLTQLIKKLRAEEWGQHVHWTRPENLHITLRFMGSYEVARIPALIQKVKEVIKDILPFSLQLETPRLFPSPARPNIIALTVCPSTELFKLARVLEFSMIEMGLAPDKHPFVPHLTLGRLSHRAAVVFPAHMALDNDQLKINGFALLHSEEINGKRTYTPLEQIAFAYNVQPKVAVGAVVIKEGKVLLIKRKHEPNQGLWAIPGGKILPGETLQHAAEREIKEETNITIRAREAIYVFDLIERDNDGQLRLHYVVIDLAADYISGELKAGDDAADARWVDASEFNQLPMTETTRELLNKIGIR